MDAVLLFHIIGACISVAGVIVPEVDRVVARKEQAVAACSCNEAMVRRIVAEELARRKGQWSIHPHPVKSAAR